MRKIKFRGKRTDNGEWIYGDLKYYPENMFCNRNVNEGGAK